MNNVNITEWFLLLIINTSSRYQSDNHHFVQGNWVKLQVVLFNTSSKTTNTTFHTAIPILIFEQQWKSAELR